MTDGAIRPQLSKLVCGKSRSTGELNVTPLEVYRERGHRRLASRTFASKCAMCLWGAEMAVAMIIDQWNPSVRRFRRETFCYGPKGCRFYMAGPTRKVPGRRGMSWDEEDWVDEEATVAPGTG